MHEIIQMVRVIIFSAALAYLPFGNADLAGTSKGCKSGSLVIHAATPETEEKVRHLIKRQNKLRELDGIPSNVPIKVIPETEAPSTKSMAIEGFPVTNA